jgi:multicomponent Na+:H+ antiporter subunit F
MTIVTTIAGGLLTIGALAALIRLILGPSVADRMVAADTLLFIGVGGLGAYIVRSGDTTYVPILVVVVLIAFLGTLVVARYIEAETDR